MSKSKVFWIVLISVVAVVAVFAGGYALYRVGYARGTTGDAGAFMSGRFDGHMFGDLDDVDEHFMPWVRRGGMMSHSGRGYFMPGYWGAGFFGLLLGGGLLALAIYGGISLVRRNSASAEEPKTKSKK
jgi:hypothetical protein